MATKSTPTATKKPRKTRKTQPEFQDGYVLASQVIQLISGSMASIARACKDVSEKNESPDAPAHCASYFNGAKQLHDMLIYSLVNSPRTEVPTHE